MENFLLNTLKNTKVINEIWNLFCYFKEPLENNGIIIKNTDVGFNFRFSFNFEKINKDSLAIKHNVNGISFSAPERFFVPEVILLRDDEIVYVDEIIYNVKQLDSLFASRELLRTIFEIIGLDIFIEDNNYYNDVDIEKEKKICNNILKDFEEHTTDENIEFANNFKILNHYIELSDNIIEAETSFKENFEMIKKNFIETTELVKNECPENSEIHNEEYLKIIDTLKSNTLSSIKKLEVKINYLKSLKSKAEENFIISTIKFEKILFSEIFNCIPENSTINDRVKFLKNNYISISNMIHNTFSNRFGNDISYIIKDFIKMNL